MQARLSIRILPLALALLAAGCAEDWRPRGADGAVAVSSGADAHLSGSGHFGASAAPRPVPTGFARLPDRGDLVGYPTQRIVRRDGAYTWHRADLSEAHALAAIVDGSMRVTTPSGQTLDFVYERHEEHPSGDWTWVGRLEHGTAADEVVLTFGDKAAFGTISQPGREPLRLTIRDGASWLIETDAARVADIRNRATRPEAPDYLVPPASVSTRGTTAATGPAMASAPTMEASTASGSPVIDLVLGYTPGFAAMYGGQTQAVTRLNNMVAITNEAYANSQMSGRVRLVHTLQVNYADNTDNGDTLEKLSGYKSGTGWITPDSAFGALRAARDQYGADLVSLVRKFNDPENAGCGIAWLIGGGGSRIDTGDEPFGYSIVSDGQDAGSDGKTYFCREETLAHEIGHNLGSQHDKATATKDGKVSQGVYAYSFGFKTGSISGNFYTVMAYGDSGQTRYRVFSNPRTTFCGGYACGVTDQADNARSQGQTMPVIAGFRASVVPVQTSPVIGLIQGVGGKCLDAANYGTANGTAIQVWSCLGGSQQQWTLLSNGALRRDSTARVLDVVGYGTANGSQLQLWDGHGGSNQSWYFTNLTVVATGSRVLDAVGTSSANGTKIQLWDGNGGAHQTWHLKGDGTITGKDGKCLDVEGWGTANGTRVQLWTCAGTPNQKWSVGPGGTIVGYGNKCLEAADGGTTNGTVVRMWDCNGGAHQVWRLRGEIRSSASNRCIDDPAFGQVNGTRVHMWDCHGGANQKWEFVSK